MPKELQLLIMDVSRRRGFVSRDPTVSKAGKGCGKGKVLKRISVKLFSIVVALVTCGE